MYQGPKNQAGLKILWFRFCCIQVLMCYLQGPRHGVCSLQLAKVLPGILASKRWETSVQSCISFICLEYFLVQEPVCKGRGSRSLERYNNTRATLKPRISGQPDVSFSKVVETPNRGVEIDGALPSEICRNPEFRDAPTWASHTLSSLLQFLSTLCTSHECQLQIPPNVRGPAAVSTWPLPGK